MSITANIRARVAEILGEDFEVSVPTSGQKAGLVAAAGGAAYLYRRSPSEPWLGAALDEDGVEVDDLPTVPTGMTVGVTAQEIADNILAAHAACGAR